jgi:hypothetical protein
MAKDLMMLKKLVLLISFCLAPTLSYAFNQALQGFCSTGGAKVSTQGMNSSTTVQASYPKCLVTVYMTGTTTEAPIFNANGTTKGNPFTANADASWLFYSVVGAGVDIVMTGGSPNPFPTPFTLTDVVAGGSSGTGSGSVIASPQFQKSYFPTAGSIATVMGDNGSTTDGAGHETALSLLPNNPINGLGMGSHLDVAADYTLRNFLGNESSATFPVARPWTQYQTVNRRYGPAQATNPFSSTLFLLSGMDNTNVVQGDYGFSA